MPESIISIRESAFNNSDISKIDIPSNVVEIGDRAFYECDNMYEVVIPDKVTRIGASAFYGCYLSRLVIGEGVKEIGYSAFYNAAYGNLVVVYCKPTTPPTLLGYTSSRDDYFHLKSDAPIYVPRDSYSKYQSQWHYDCYLKVYDF